MSVNTPSQEHTDRQPDWALMRAFVEGRRAVLLDSTYLTKLPGHDTDTYKLFSERSYLFNATQRSVDGLVGLMFRKAPAAEWSESFAPYAHDMTRTGHSAAQFAEQIANEVVTVGACGVLVDHPAQEAPGTLAQADALSQRPYARLYTIENVLSVRETVIGSDRVYSQIRLAEINSQPDPQDEFADINTDRVRVLDLDESGNYRVRVYEKSEGSPDTEFVLISEEWPRRAGSMLQEIPFRFFTRRGNVADYPKPPLLDLAESNNSHLNDSALLQWGLMWTANPTPCFIDLKLAEGETIKLGSSNGLMFGEGGDGRFMEFSGRGLESIRNSLEDKRRDMGTLGARMLMEERKGVEAAQTAQIHRAGENSILSAIAAQISAGMEWALDTIGEWAGVPADVSFSINQDYMATSMSGQDLSALMMAWQGGGISQGDLFAVLQRGEIIDDKKTLEEHQDELEGEALPFAEPDAAG